MKTLFWICSIIGIVILIGFGVNSYQTNQDYQAKLSNQKLIEQQNVKVETQPEVQQPTQLTQTTQKTQTTSPKSTTKPKVITPYTNTYTPTPIPKVIPAQPLNVDKYINELNKPLGTSVQECQYSPLGQRYNCHWVVK